jgi:hypothetical protein
MLPPYLYCAWSRCLSQWSIAFLIITVHLLPVTAIEVNRTIDDHYLDPYGNGSVAYTGSWFYGPDCVNCAIRVVPISDTQNSSWHDGHVDVGDGPETSLTLTFLGKTPPFAHNSDLTFYLGTAIYVYGIIPNVSTQSPIRPTFINLSFTLDGEPMGPNFYNETLHELVPGHNFKFNALVYSKTGLTNKNHSLMVSLAPGTSTARSGFLFDYATYTCGFLCESSSLTADGENQIRRTNPMSFLYAQYYRSI